MNCVESLPWQCQGCHQEDIWSRSSSHEAVNDKQASLQTQPYIDEKS